MFFGPVGGSNYASKICQIPEIDNIPDEISGIFNGIKVWIFGTTYLKWLLLNRTSFFKELICSFI